MAEKMRTYVDMSDIGVDLAHDGDNAQGEFINSFGRELFVACKGERGFETQCCYISDKMDLAGRRLIKMLAEFVELREKEA